MKIDPKVWLKMPVMQKHKLIFAAIVNNKH